MSKNINLGMGLSDRPINLLYIKKGPSWAPFFILLKRRQLAKTNFLLYNGTKMIRPDLIGVLVFKNYGQKGNRKNKKRFAEKQKTD